MTQPIIIAGVHRCGTSWLAGCLQRAGIQMHEQGSTLTQHNEDPFILNLNIHTMDRLDLRLMSDPLTDATADCDSFYFDMLGYKLRRVQEGDDRWGFKAPRIGHLSPLYVQAFPKAKWIICSRHLKEAGASWSERGQGTKRDCTVSLVKQYVSLLDVLGEEDMHIFNYDGEMYAEESHLEDFLGHFVDLQQSWKKSGRVEG